MNEKKRKVVLIFGRTGSGKSFLVHKLIKKINRYIIIDPMKEYTEGIIFTDIDSFIEFIQNNYSTSGDLKLIVRFDSDEIYELFFTLCFELENYTLILEEAEAYISASVKKSEFLRIVKYGRHKSISIIAVARRIPELSNDIKFNADIIYSYKNILPRDIKYLNELGFSRVEKLKKYEYEIVEY